MENNKSFMNKAKGILKKITGVLIIAGIALTVLKLLIPRDAEKTPAFQKTGTRTTTLRRQVLNDSVTVTGTVESAKTVNVTCTVTGVTVHEILVQPGDYVEEGDVIAQLDTSSLLESIAKTKEKLAENQQTAQLNYTQAQTDMNRAYDACIAQEAVLNKAVSARDNARYNFSIAQSAVANQQYAYDNAVTQAQQANNTNNQYIAVLNNRKSALDSAGAAVSAAQDKLAKAQVAYDTAISENSENAESLKTALDTAQAEYDSAAALYSTADAEYQAAYLAVYDSATGTQAAYDAAKRAEADGLNSLDSAKAQTNYNTLETEYNNAEKARRSARTTLDNLQKTYTNAVAAFEKAEDNLENASTSDELEQLYEKFDSCTIKANASGTVTQVNVQVGSIANGTIAVIQDTDNLKISTSFAEYDVQNIKIGMQCIITSDANDKQLSGYVSQISPVASGGNMGSSDVSFAGEVTINGTDHGLLIGMNAQAEVIITQVSDVYVVPYDAVGVNEKGESVVYVRRGEDFEPVVVTTGMETDYYIEISSESLRDGMVIRSAANEDESDSVVFTEDGESTDEKFNMGILGGMTGGNMPSGGGRPDRGDMPSGGMPGGRG